MSTGAVGSGNFQSDLSDWKNSFNQQNGNNTGGGSGGSNPSGGYKFKPKEDLDWRGTGKGVQNALDEAFKRTGIPKEEFTVTEWARDANGKSFPVEWTGPNGAQVNIDLPHLQNSNAPQYSHVGWQTPGKRGNNGATRGHIFIDEVPFNRSSNKPK
ncbi:MAG: polymorphic toxin type 47 domain-containing protein [Candidatus Melainabacteria bacterium]